MSEDAILAVLADLGQKSELVVVAAVATAATLCWLAIKSYRANHPYRELLLRIGGPEGRIGLRFDDRPNLDLGYGVLQLDERYWVAAYDGKGKKCGRSVMLMTRSKRSSFDAGAVELSEQDLQRMGVKANTAGEWPIGVRLKAVPARQLSLRYWWSHNDLSIRLSVRLTAAVLVLQELVLPSAKALLGRFLAAWTIVS
jgi:hypothetical protein